ncbi:16S rRNA (uracil(1498)-N(3))-methyltransferase [Ramlibacter sp. PS4R-6]|uniref:16S rRNA (uracil(1498)-N(3))-methyltransferase n=1 Tax=Ramlibacter sp. PS4R-6 TaxID=3133438 RepID=UPI0030A27D3B
MPRLYCPTRLSSGQALALPPGPARHVQVLRLQPGEEVLLFNGEGGQWRAVIERMGRSDVDVRVTQYEEVEREVGVAVHLAIGIPANERMDWLVEKATELGAASIQPLVTARAILRVAGERAQKKQEHWQAIAAAACEQSGRNRLPVVQEPAGYAEWLTRALPPVRFVLSLDAQAPRLDNALLADGKECLVLSGPEGGLDAREEQAAVDAGFARVSLGPRVLRAETAPIAALALLTLS